MSLKNIFAGKRTDLTRFFVRTQFFVVYFLLFFVTFVVPTAFTRHGSSIPVFRVISLGIPQRYFVGGGYYDKRGNSNGTQSSTVSSIVEAHTPYFETRLPQSTTIRSKKIDEDEDNGALIDCLLD
jgi:hypothetical protein